MQSNSIQAQQDFIRSVILGVGPQYVWISGNELVSEGTYEWGFNTGDIVEFFEWAGGQPSNTVCSEGGNQCTNDQAGKLFMSLRLQSSKYSRLAFRAVLVKTK